MRPRKEVLGKYGKYQISNLPDDSEYNYIPEKKIEIEMRSVAHTSVYYISHNDRILAAFNNKNVAEAYYRDINESINELIDCYRLIE